MLNLVGIVTQNPYIKRASLLAMMINALVINGLDPGAVPGGSTINLHSVKVFDGAEIGSTDV